MRTEQQRRLIVAWRDPQDEAIFPVGLLTMSSDGGRTLFTFAYLRSAENLERFRPLASFPELDRLYVSERLFPLFENRVMARERPDYESYLEHLRLAPDADPFLVLAQSGGRRETDRIEVFPEPEVASGRLVSRFFARGIRHIPGASEAVADLAVGELLTLMEERDNPYNPRALLMHGTSRQPVGYVPNYLVTLLHDLRERCGEEDVILRVAHINPPDVPSHIRLLCELDSCAPDGYEALGGPDFEPFVDADLAAR